MRGTIELDNLDPSVPEVQFLMGHPLVDPT